MYQIDNSTAAVAQPAPTPAGTAGFFTDGNPASGTAATIVPAEWLNAVMMELMNVVTAGGLTPTKNVFDQVAKAIKAIGKQRTILNDTGAANSYTAVNSPALLVSTWTDGISQSVKIANANSGPSTYSPDGLTAIPIYGLGLQPLQGGELRAGGVATMVRFTIAGVNGGNPICVLLDCFGAAQQVGPASQSQHAVQLGQVGHGQCRLSIVSATTIALNPYGGNNLVINGVPRQIPGGGALSISNSGLAASTLYYVYAYMNAGVMALEFSTTGHSTGTTGVEQKSGDATRTLVGMVRTNASTQFVDSAAQRFCLNWFNRRSISALNTFVVNRSTTSSTPVELSPTERAEFLSWGDESALLSFSASASQNTTSGSFSSILAVDGLQLAAMVVNVSAANIPQNVSAMAGANPSEGYHYATALGAATSGFTATWLGQYPTLTANIRG